jgi:lysophospholipase
MAQITPEEFGSWDPNLSAMANITYVGTHLNNGSAFAAHRFCIF